MAANINYTIGFRETYRHRVYSNNGNSELTNLVPVTGVSTLLDVGCGTGSTARLLRLRCPSARIIGITLSDDEAAAARLHCDQVFIADIQDEKSFKPKTRFDGIILSHVLEHLVNPEHVLSRLKEWLSPAGAIYVALPNIAFYRLRAEAVLGRFEYTSSGHMDSTHLRFYTYRSARSLIERAGFLIEEHKATGSVPLRPARAIFPKLAAKIDTKFTTLFPNLFGSQTIIKARPCQTQGM